MKTDKRILSLLLVLLAVGCTEEKKYVTQVIGPEDWQPPVVEWLSPPEAELRGTVGIDITVRDSSRIECAVLFVDGLAYDTLTEPLWRFVVATDSMTVGVHLLEARAWDEYGNLGVSPILRVYAASGVPEGIRVLWVPDDYSLIQAAINAAQDYDTIRVRDGVYYEILNLFGKGMWFESLNGPLATRINGKSSNSVITVSPCSVPATIRGFWLEGAERLVRFELGGQANFINNIFLDDTATALLSTTYSGGEVDNNLFMGSSTGVNIGYHWGSLYNNIITGVENIALWNAAIGTNPLLYGYNILWNNGQDYGYFEPGIGDLSVDPRIDLVNGRLLGGSPAIDAGNPQILDLNSSRSDIGPFGGPWAYDN